MDNSEDYSINPSLSVMLKYAKRVGIDIEKTDNEGCTPLHTLCSSWPKQKVGRILKEAKENYGIEFNLNAIDDNGKTPMELCRT